MMENIFRWGNPDAFGYLIFIVLLLGLAFFYENLKRKKLDSKFGAKVNLFLSQSLSLTKRRFVLVLQAIALMFFVIALARPQSGASQQEIKNEGVELMILADVSESMLAEDVRPSRLAQMKIELSRLIEMMPGNKTGLIAFAGSAALLSPLTSDPTALRMYIDTLDVNSVSSQGTNFQTALTYAEEAFERGGVTQEAQAKTTRVIIVVSDGEDQEEGALEAAKKMAAKGIYIFTIAYGTEKGSGIPVKDRFGQMTTFKKDAAGATILTQVKGEFLKKLAEAGQGEFYFGVFNGDHLKLLTDKISLLEKTQFKSEVSTQYDEQFTYPLLLGFLLLFVSFFISDYNADRADWKGRYEQ